MNDSSRSRHVPAGTANRIDPLCDEFERQFRAGESPRIEDWLDSAAATDRPALLRELLGLELELRVEHKDRPEPEDYLARFPHLAPEIQSLFAELQRDLSTVRPATADPSDSVPPPATDAAAEFPRDFGDFELLERLGQGGMGVVYKARQRSLDRIVALKMIRSGQFASDDELRRFQREAQLAAQLDHPGIVPVHAVGAHQGQPYIAMGFVEGQGLDGYTRYRPLPAEEAVRLLIDICDAVGFAHERAIIHRDLKPANILLDRQGQPRVTDFGLAMRVDTESSLTAGNAILGTPSFMPPEQARGDRQAVTIRSDVYSLGAMLYCLLTGRPPFRGTNVLDTLEQVRTQEPVTPRRLNPEIGRDLEAVCLKCLEKQPQRRYESCQTLADDLRRCLCHEPTRARPLGPFGRSWRWCLRHRLAASSIVLLLLFASAAVTWQQTRPAYLDLHVTPPEAALLLDGQEIPMDSGGGIIPWKPGRFPLTVTADGFEPQQHDVVLIRGRDNAARLTVELKPDFGYLRLESQPPGAAVEIRDETGTPVASGTTPFHSPRLPARRYSLTLSKELYRPLSQDIEIPNGDRVALLPAVPLEPALEGAESLVRFEQLLERLNRPITKPWEFSQTPLHEVIQTIAAVEEVTILFDTIPLEQERISLDRPVTRRLVKMSLATALTVVLESHRLTYLPELSPNGHLTFRITSQRDAARSMNSVIYPIGDLLNAGGNTANERDLVRDLMQSVPGPWRARDGLGGFLTINPDIGALSVTQTWRAQAQVHAYLKELRRNVIAQQPPSEQAGEPAP